MLLVVSTVYALFYVKLQCMIFDVRMDHMIIYAYVFNCHESLYDMHHVVHGADIVDS